MDVAATYNTGTGTNNNPDPQPIQPSTEGAWIVLCGGGAASNGATLYTAAYLTNFLSYNGADTSDGTVGAGYYTGWTSGSYNGAAFGGGSTNAANSWGCTSVALRPAADSSVTLTVADGAHALTNDTIDLAVNVVLAVADATHAHTAESPAVTVPYVEGTVDFWETFDFSSLTTGNLDSNDSAAEGTWSITDASSRLSLSDTGEKQAPGIFNGEDDDEGTHGLGYTNSGTAHQSGFVRYDFAAGKSSGLSWAFWFYAPSAMVGTWGEHDICSMYNATESDDVFIKANDSADGTNLDLFIHNSAAYSTNKVTLPELDKWYWIAAQWLPGVSWKFSVFNEDMDLVGEVTHQTTPTTDDLDFIIIGSYTGASTSGMGGTMWFDDLVMDWTSPSQSYPLLGSTSLEEDLSVADAAHALTSDSIELLLDYRLTVADAAHSHTSDAVVLGVEQRLVVADAVHAHASESPTLEITEVVGQWLLNEASWNGTPGEVIDSVDGHSGVAVGGVTTIADGKFGRCGSFDGVGYVSFGSSADYNVDNGSIGCWIKTTSPGSSFRGVFVKGLAWGLFLNDGEFGTYDWGTSTWRGTGISPTDGRWHHLGMSFQSGVTNGTKLYLDGVPVLTTTLTVSDHLTYPLLLGSNSFDQKITASLDQPTLYNWALSDAEWAALAEPELVVSDGAHAVTSDPISLELMTAVALAVDDTLHGVSSDLLELLCSALLEVSNAHHAHTASSPTVFVPTPITLTISACLHYHATHNVQEIGGAVGVPLTPSSSLHYHNSTNLVLGAA
jgi:hypothetical protein